jgi:hypothetical protein
MRPGDDPDAYLRRLLDRREDAGWTPIGEGYCRRCESMARMQLDAEGRCIYCWRADRAAAYNRLACAVIHGTRKEKETA